MLQTMKDACKNYPRAIDHALCERIGNLYDLIGHEPKLAKAFFSKTCVASGMKTQLRLGCGVSAKPRARRSLSLSRPQAAARRTPYLHCDTTAKPKLDLVAMRRSNEVSPVGCQHIDLSLRATSKCYFLATMGPEPIKDRKLVAIGDETSASDALDEAAQERRRSKGDEGLMQTKFDENELLLLRRNAVFEVTAGIFLERA